MRRWHWVVCLLAALASGCRSSEGRAAAGWTAIGVETGEARAVETAETGERYLALTFDDGPRRGITDRLLDGLGQRGARATFFVVGEQIGGNEDLIRRMAAEGHQIGNHTYSHTRLLDAEPETVIREIRRTEVLLAQLTGAESCWLRPPYGLIDSQRAALVDTPMIYWSVDPEDWRLLDARRVVDQVQSQVTEGDIILLHDFYPSSVDAALELVDRFQGEGYTLVTVEELFRLQGVVPQPGVLYASPTAERRLNGA